MSAEVCLINAVLGYLKMGVGVQSCHLNNWGNSSPLPSGAWVSLMFLVVGPTSSDAQELVLEVLRDPYGVPEIES